MITENPCKIHIVAVKGKGIKGELMGVGDLSLTPILNFKGERLQARTGPLLQLLYKNSARSRSNHKPMVCIILFLNIVSIHKRTGAC